MGLGEAIKLSLWVKLMTSFRPQTDLLHPLSKPRGKWCARADDTLKTSVGPQGSSTKED